MRTTIAAGNWKMNTNSRTGVELASALAGGLQTKAPTCEVIVCPPFPYLAAVVAAVRGTGIQVGAQDLYHQEDGAYTGEVSAAMLLDVGCTHALIGHSERRHVLKECHGLINLKLKAALKAGLQGIFCVGETLAERDAWQTEKVLDEQMCRGLAGITAEQMAAVVIAYEPVWAIGTGVTATTAQAEEAHRSLRGWLQSHYSSEVAEKTRILYGGSVKPGNARELVDQPNVDGALVGGASLEADSFLKIIAAVG